MPTRRNFLKYALSAGVGVSQLFSERASDVQAQHLPRTYSITGRVTFINERGKKRGVPEVTMALSGSVLGSTATSRSGYYRFRGLPDGTTATVTPSKPGWVFSPSSLPISITGRSVRKFDFIATSPAPSEVTYKTYGLDFSPYVDGQDPNRNDQISEEQLRTRMAIVAPYTEWIRTFGSTNGLENAGRVAHEMNLKIACGAWLGRDLSANERELSNLISAAQAGHCDIAIVGSEALLRRDLTEQQLIGYLNRFRQTVPGVPVTTADVYGELLAHPAVLNAVDVVFVNYFPYWEGVDIQYAIAALHGWHQRVAAAAYGKEIVVSETGWPSCGNQIRDAVPSPENASFYFLNFVSWARANDVPYFYFSALDEEWKAAYEGPQGACWGVFDKNGGLKPGMQDVFDGKTMPDNWSGLGIPGGPGEPVIEFSYVPPYGSFDDLRGHVWHVRPADYRVVVYINVNGGWWIKPYFNSPLTLIHPDGSWVCDITTGGIDQLAGVVSAYLAPASYSPPLAGGWASLPAELSQFPKAEVARSPQ